MTKTIYATIEATRCEPVLSHIVDVVRCVLHDGWWHMRYNRKVYKLASDGDQVLIVLRHLDHIAATELGPAWHVETFEISKKEWLQGIAEAYGFS